MVHRILAPFGFNIFYSILVVVHLEEVFNTTPEPVKSNFSCSEREAGFYADIASNCRIYHTCDDQGNKFTYHCPEETAFRQEALICDHAHLVDCQTGTRIGRHMDNDGRANSNVNPFYNNYYKPKTAVRGQQRHNVYHQENATRLSSRSFRIYQKPYESSLAIVKPDVNVRSTFNLEINRSNRNEPPFQTTSRHPVPHSDDARKTEAVKSTAFTGIESSGEKCIDREEEEKPVEMIRPGEVVSRRPLSSYKYQGYDGDFARSFQNNNYPYVETLRSMQNSTEQSVPSVGTTSPATTAYGRSTLIDVFAAPLKPLTPNELEFDPYYPRHSSSTEAYYTPGYRNNGTRKSLRPSTQQPPLDIQFQIPALLPNFNDLEDLVDRRKLLYIPRIKLN